MIHLLLALLVSSAVAAGWPSVGELEAGIGARSGAEFPKMVVTRSGAFHVYYVRTTERGNGRYSVEVQLRR